MYFIPFAAQITYERNCASYFERKGIMQARVFLLLICAALLPGTVHAIDVSHLTEEPVVTNGDFQYPEIVIEDEDVFEWVEGGGYNGFSGIYTREYGTGDWNAGGDGSTQMCQIVSPNDCIYQAVCWFQPNTKYELTCFIAKRSDQLGPKGRVELWAGGDPALIIGDNEDDGFYVSEAFQLAVSGATRVAYAEFDYSHLDNSAPSPGANNFTFLTETSHTTSDPMYLLFMRESDDGGQLGVDAVTLIIAGSGNAAPILPKDGATDVPVTTDDDPDDPSHTTLAWLPPRLYTAQGYDVYFHTSEPNLLAAETVDTKYGMPRIASLTTATHIDPSPSSNLEFSSTYYWVVEAYEPEPNNVPIPFEDYSTFTTMATTPIVNIILDGARTWPGEQVPVPATVVQVDTEQSFTVEYTITAPAGYTGDPNLFLVEDLSNPAEPSAIFTAVGTDPSILGFYEITLEATNAVDGNKGSDTMWIQVSETACEAKIANGDLLSPFDDNDDCVIDITDLAAWVAAWMDDRNPSDPTYYGYTP
jgi:hypothetical protein